MMLYLQNTGWAKKTGPPYWKSTNKIEQINKRFIIIYADDIVIIVTGTDLHYTMKNIVEQHIKIVKGWQDT